MSAAHDHENTVPQGALRLAGALIVFVLLLVSAVKIGWIDHAASPTAERAEKATAPVETRSLAFRDTDDGAVLVTDQATGEEVARFGDEGGGFVRGVLRGLARERHMKAIGQEPPFELTLWNDGALSLTDSATGRVIELGAFGPDNRAVFAKLLDGKAS